MTKITSAILALTLTACAGMKAPPNATCEQKAAVELTNAGKSLQESVWFGWLFFTVGALSEVAPVIAVGALVSSASVVSSGSSLQSAGDVLKTCGG